MQCHRYERKGEWKDIWCKLVLDMILKEKRSRVSCEEILRFSVTSTERRMISVGWNKRFLTARDCGIRWRGRGHKDATFLKNLVI